MLGSLVLTLVWTFNVSALTLSHRGDLLRRVVLASWNLVVLLVGVELAWAFWALWSGQPPVVCGVALWLGLNLLVTVRAAREHAARLSSGQIVLLCAWWLALLGMVVQAAWLSGLLDFA